MLNLNPRRHLIWFVTQALDIDMTKVREVYIDATYNVSKSNTHLYALIAEELGYGVPLGFMLVEIHDKEDTRNEKHHGEAKLCNQTFYLMAKELGIGKIFVHTDKDFSEISAAQVHLFHCIVEC